MTATPTLERLYATLAARRGGDPDKSYTAKLFGRGREKIVQKLGEEAVETVIAGMNNDRAEIVSESADLLYHLLVLWIDAGLKPEDIWAELERREGVSGLTEKAARRAT